MAYARRPQARVGRSVASDRTRHVTNPRLAAPGVCHTPLRDDAHATISLDASARVRTVRLGTMAATIDRLRQAGGSVDHQRQQRFSRNRNPAGGRRCAGRAQRQRRQRRRPRLRVADSQLITRRVREAQVYCELLPHDAPLRSVLDAAAPRASSSRAGRPASTTTARRSCPTGCWRAGCRCWASATACSCWRTRSAATRRGLRRSASTARRAI